MTTKGKAAMKEVKQLREPARMPTQCCGRPMRKLSHPSSTTGELKIILKCEGTCSRQVDITPPKEVKTPVTTASAAKRRR
jgi:hypothetical protein